VGKDRAKFPGRYFGGIAKPISLTCFPRDSLAHSCPSKSVGLPGGDGREYPFSFRGRGNQQTDNQFHFYPPPRGCVGVHSPSLLIIITIDMHLCRINVASTSELLRLNPPSFINLSIHPPIIECFQPDHSIYFALLRTHHNF
jgi:hypothetical protein